MIIAAWIWSAKDYSEGEPVQESFAIRFKNPDIANEFKKAFDLARSKSAKASGSPAKATTNEKSSSGTAQPATTTPKTETKPVQSSDQRKSADIFLL